VTPHFDGNIQNEGRLSFLLLRELHSLFAEFLQTQIKSNDSIIELPRNDITNKFS
jgi:hypothetical protein